MAIFDSDAFKFTQYPSNETEILRELRELSENLEQQKEQNSKDAKLNKRIQIATLIIGVLTLISTVLIGIAGLLY